MDPTKFPYIEDNLLSALDRAFPVKPITPATPLNEIMFSAGQRDVFERLKIISKQQRDQRK